MPPVTTELVVRPAVPADIEDIRELDRLCFPPGRLDREPAHAGELEGALADGQIALAVRDGVTVGMIQTEFLDRDRRRRHERPDHAYLAALAVHPDHQRGGVGQRLVEHFIEEVKSKSPRPSATSVTSPANVGMIDLLTRNGFTVQSGMRDYFGPGKDRVYCQLRSRPPVADPDDRVLIPVGAVDHLFDVLEREEMVITGVIKGVQSDFFEVSKLEVEDLPGLRADETAISTGEAGAVLAALTFLLGLSFTVPDYSEPLRILILVATILTLGATQIYANASGSLSRLRDDRFGLYMKWGNLLLEFGGVYPLALVLPAVFAQASSNSTLSIATAVIVGVIVIAYEYSPFSISGRYHHGFVFHAGTWITAALPILAVPLYLWTGRDTLWVVCVGVVLLARLLWLVPTGRQEIGAHFRPTRRRRARRTS